MKKHLLKLLAVLLLGTMTATAQNNGLNISKFLPMLNGYNVLASTNAVQTAGVGYGSTNVLYTTFVGQILYSLTNNTVNGTAQTNIVAADAFKLGAISADANSDINANAAFAIYVNNTNWIPIAITNVLGQWFVPTAANTTNYATAAWATVWPLAQSQYPSWMYPATTNLYPQIGAASTNLVTVSLYRELFQNPFSANYGPTIGGNTIPSTFETTSAFSFSFNANGATPVAIITNLPTGWMQGCRRFYAAVSVGTNQAQNQYVLINSMGLIQPQP
jgi:hypothetical protein